MTDLVERLRDTPNWLKQDFGNYKSAVSRYDRAPFEAADEIVALRLALTELLQCQDGLPMMGQEASRRAEAARALLTAASRATVDTQTPAGEKGYKNDR